MRFEYVKCICTKKVLTEFHRLISIRRDRKQEFLLHWAASPLSERAFLLFPVCTMVLMAAMPKRWRDAAWCYLFVRLMATSLRPSSHLGDNWTELRTMNLTLRRGKKSVRIRFNICNAEVEMLPISLRWT